MTNNSIDWKQEIVSTVLVRSNIYDLDLGKIYGYSLPKLAAADAEIERSENRLGFQFDEDYRSFLRHANGWDSLALSDGHAFGVGEYPNGPRYLEATRLMYLIWDEGSFLDTDAEIADVFPFCASEYSSDIYLMKKRHVSGEPRVYWFAGYLIDSFPSFLEFFRSMRAYDQRTLSKLKSSIS